MAFLIITILVVMAIIAIATFTDFELDDKHYERLKWLVVRWHYIVVFIGVIVKTFTIPYGVETVTVVAAIGACIAGLMGVSSKNYYANRVQENFNTDSFEEMMEAEDEGKTDTTEQ